MVRAIRAAERRSMVRGVRARRNRRAEASPVTSSLVRRLIRHEIRIWKGSRESWATAPTAVGFHRRLVRCRLRTIRSISATVLDMILMSVGDARFWLKRADYNTLPQEVKSGCGFSFRVPRGA